MNSAITKVDWPTWPQFGDEEIEAVGKVVRSQQLFAATEVKKFEQDFARFLGSKRAVGIGNATQGLHLALAALDVGEGDEVVVTPCSWISSSSCVLMQNAVPVFVDIESESLGLDPELLEQAITPLTKAIIPVHILGYPARIGEICEVARAHNIPVIEDASHAPGASVNGKMVGTFGLMGVFSLQQRKTISTGDGGVIVTDDDTMADKLWRLRSFGDQELSYNYRMTEFAGVLGQIGLRKLAAHNEERAWAAHYLSRVFDAHPKVRIRHPRPHEVGVYYAVAIELSVSDDESTELMAYLEQRGYPMRKAFPPLNRHPHFNPTVPPARGLPWEHLSYRGSMRGVSYKDLHLPVSYEYCYGRVVELYTHPGITAEQLDLFASDLAECLPSS
ncbi:MAG: DegT/DnrJ/EryC1/StrS family aminotransferase [Actinomycetota bacterium]